MHRQGDPAEFSASDRKGLESFVPHVWWRLRHRPYLALVFRGDDRGWSCLADRSNDARACRGAVRGGAVRPISDGPDARTVAEVVTTESRFDRNERFSGREGQERIEGIRLAIVGCGGLGSILTQQAAYLGFRRFGLVDADIVTGSSMNRLVGAVPSDVDRTPKVEVAERVIRSVGPAAEVNAVRQWLEHPNLGRSSPVLTSWSAASTTTSPGSNSRNWHQGASALLRPRE